MNLRLMVCALFAAFAAQVSAHPGHPPTEHGLAHLLASPYHLLTLAVVGLVLIAIAKMIRHRLVSGFLAVAGIASVGAAAFRWIVSS
jgi:hypothetical protein